MSDKKCDFCYKKQGFKKQNSKEKLKDVKLVVFDMDGVLTDIYSSWKYVHDFFNTSNEKSVYAYLKGEIDDMEFIRRDAALWKQNGRALKKEKLVEILSDVSLMHGAKECISYLKKRNVKTAIVSAGLNVLAEKVGSELGIDYVYSNGINVDENGFLTDEGIVGVKLKAKDETVKKLAEKTGINKASIVAVGNSCFDVPMFEVAGLGIAFNPDDECVKKYADVVISEKDLRLVYMFLQNTIKSL
jgi:phosphoserine phosphatase